MRTTSFSRSRGLLRLLAGLVLCTSVPGAAFAQPSPEPATSAPVPDPAPAPLPAPIEPEAPTRAAAPAAAIQPAAPTPAMQPAAPAPAMQPTAPAPAMQPAAPAKPSHFFDHINVRGYTQVRFNQLLESNERLVNLQGDRSVGGDAGFLIRRARIVLQGDIHPQIWMYLQTDFAGSAGDTLHVPSMRDWYFDVALDSDKELRFRVGQSKVPFGFENPQSSQNRLTFDRSDALNSAASGERDLGIFVYYAPKEVRRRLKDLVDSGLKGSGDYGMLALGVYDGQTINLADVNANKHVVARASYPFLLGEQYLEIGLSGYTGLYVVRTDDGIEAPPNGVRDARAAAHFVLYPQPFGLQLEYNVGDGPELTNLVGTDDAAGETAYTGVVSRERLHGGYALASLRLGTVIPFVRASMYEGGKKHERNAPRYEVKELEAGLEWQIAKPLEVTAAFTIAERTDGGRIPYALEDGHLLRLQAQFNY